MQAVLWIPYIEILLMVQKSQGQPPGMLLKPCKPWDKLSTSTGLPSTVCPSISVILNVPKGISEGELPCRDQTASNLRVVPIDGFYPQKRDHVKRKFIEPKHRIRGHVSFRGT